MKVNNYLVWHTNRQDILQRNVFQRMGLAYTLPDFLDSPYPDNSSEKRGLKKR